jgi:lipopolysaccharide transport protein LptA
VDLSSKGGIAVDLERNVAVAKDDVVIRRDDVTVCCDEAEAEYEGGRIRRVTCRGHVAIVRPDGTRASAEVAVYEAEPDRVTLTGAPKVYAKEASLAGDRIVYDIAKDRLLVEGERSKFAFKPPEGGAPARKCPP